MSNRPRRILFVFAELRGGEAEELAALLACSLDPARYRFDAIPCFRANGASDEWRDRLIASGLTVDPVPSYLSFEDTVSYLVGRIPVYDIVVSCGNAPDIHPALDRLFLRPPLIEYVGDVLAGPDAVQHWAAWFDRVIAERPPLPRPTGLFRTFIQGGFECSTHRRAHDRRRVDVIAASHHDVHAAHDYRELAGHGILTIRDGLRWHLIEREPDRYDWSSLETQLAAARAAGTEVIWDLLHYGWPDHLDIWSPDFITSFAAFAAAAARHIGPAPPGQERFYAPINEISFFSWAGGEAAYLNPFAHGRGHELKVQLVRAAIAAMRAIRAVDPAARFVHADPVVNVVADAARPEDTGEAEGFRRAQFQAWDMIAGKVCPELGGEPGLLDVVGVNYYPVNQWVRHGPPLTASDPRSWPFHELLAETYARYGRPIFVSETGVEGDGRPGWFRMILDEVAIAIELGVPVEGVCLYPILDHPGWDDDRYCPNGLLAWADDVAGRVPHPGLADIVRAVRSPPVR